MTTSALGRVVMTVPIPQDQNMVDPLSVSAPIPASPETQTSAPLPTNHEASVTPIATTGETKSLGAVLGLTGRPLPTFSAPGPLTSHGPAYIIAVGVFFGQLVVGFTNDLNDFADDKKHRRLEKPLVAGTITEKQLRKGIWVALVLAIVINLFDNGPIKLNHLLICRYLLLKVVGMLVRRSLINSLIIPSLS